MNPASQVVSEILGQLDFAVLERLSGGEFEIHGTPPDWLAAFFGPPEKLGEDSFFLADFLEQAAAEFWADESAVESVQSGLWEESNAAGESRFFEAIAMKVGDANILVIEGADERHNREQMFVQQWHVDTLESRRLGKEIEKKEILLDCIVHDLSGPLSTIMMNLQHLRRSVDNEFLDRPIGLALGQAERQRDLIRSIAEAFRSDLSSFDPLGLSPEAAPDLSKVADEVVQAHRVAAKERGIDLVFQSQPFYADCRVVAEESHLSRVLENLVLNALRHSPDNSRVTVSVEEDPSGSAFTASVEDEGPGIAPEVIETLFQPFVKGQKTGGQAGLGLYFCKMMVELWGGAIGYHSSPIGGARFWFQLPVISKENIE